MVQNKFKLESALNVSDFTRDTWLKRRTALILTRCGNGTLSCLIFTWGPQLRRKDTKWQVPSYAKSKVLDSIPAKGDYRDLSTLKMQNAKVLKLKRERLERALPLLGILTPTPCHRRRGEGCFFIPLHGGSEEVPREPSLVLSFFCLLSLGSIWFCKQIGWGEGPQREPGMAFWT